MSETGQPRPLSEDTPLEIERVWIEEMRRRGPLWRLERAVSLTSFCWRAARDAFARAHPEASARECDAWLLEERYGTELARKVMDYRDRLPRHDL